MDNFINKELLWTWLSMLPRNRIIKYRLVKEEVRLHNLWNKEENEMNILRNTNKKFFEGVQDNNIRKGAIKAYNKAVENKIKVLSVNCKGYPVLLKTTVDAPAVLFIKGNLDNLKNPISVIGSRKATAYGIRAAENISEGLALRGVSVISGLARGIDSKAHEGALKGEGYTYAVIGSGLDVIYPPENERLFKRICENGAVISEYAPGTLPLPQNFPARNRIISGMSNGVVVIEAGKESGTLITVDFALEQGRDVFAVPGNIYSSKSAGTNNLIREGAKIVTSAEEIVEEYEFYKNKKSELMNLRKYIKESIESGEQKFENLENMFNLTVKDINREIVKMQLEGCIVKGQNGMYFMS